ncbi:MAG: VanW family protein [Clostridia bacterium]|nr:VanW family protein [Clostridia bacterium]
MTRKIILSTIVALTVFVGAFVCPTAQAMQNPWDVCAKINYKGDFLCYRLSQNLPNDANANLRGFYLSAKQKRQIANDLLALGLPNVAVYNYVLPNFNSILQHFGYVERPKQDATVSFDGNFRYTGCQNGVEIDVDTLFDKLLCGGQFDLPLVVHKAVTEQQIRQHVVQKSTFFTSFNTENKARSHNICLATQSVNGTTVLPGQTFSFNNVVGKRTAERGYQNAKVIVDGAYTDGIGGGVCQVSTTLYNALLLAGLPAKACQHSLVPSYVMAGFDAMVSDGIADLTFVNVTNYPIYIKGQVDGNKIHFTVFGTPNTFEIVRQNVEQRQPFNTVFVVDATKYPNLVFQTDRQVVQNGSDGVVAEAFLQYFQQGQLVKKIKIRTCNYKKVDMVIAQGALPTP